MSRLSLPPERVFWYLQSEIESTPLQGNHEVDVLIVGGGMAGISAAYACAERGKSVMLVERAFCGSGASGKSSGFITPNAELGLTHFVDVYGAEQAKRIWDFVTSGVALIDQSIKKHSLTCDYVEEDTLIVANSTRGFKDLAKEHDNYQKLGYQSHLHTAGDLQKILASKAYYGGMQFGPTFGINVFAYAQEMKKVLVHKGVQVYEETPVVAAGPNYVITPHGRVTARNIIFCLDRYFPEIGLLNDRVYQAETFVVVSEPLSAEGIASIFPQQRYMLWDTDFVYQYFRLTGDHRFMIGGSTILRTFHWQTSYNPRAVYKKLTEYVCAKFPQLDLTFEYMWPGLIGVSQDLKPIVGYSRTFPAHYYVTGATGLPWAAALGTYAAHAVLDKRNDFDDFFSPYRTQIFPGWTQKIIGKANAFSCANLINIIK